MTYKIQIIRTVAEGFKTKKQAEEWASNNITEDEDTTWRITK